MFNQNRVGVLTVALDRRCDATVSWIANVANDDESIPSEHVEVTTSDVPLAVAVFDPLVSFVEQVKRADPGFDVFSERD